MKHLVLALVVVASLIGGGGRAVLASGHEAATPLEAVETLIKPFHTPGSIPDACNALMGQVRACPVTERLRNRLEQGNQPEETGNLVSRSQNPPMGVGFMLVENTQDPALVNVRWTVGQQGELSYTITFVVQGQGGKWLVDDAYCAGQPESSVHNPSVGPCSPSPQVAGPGTLPSTGEAVVPVALLNTGVGSGSRALVATALVCFVLGVGLRLRRRIA